MHTALYTASPDEVSATVAVYDAIKRRLLAGQFRLGSRLGEVALSEQFGVSRTPIREALARLFAEGFVVRLPEGGYSPAAPDMPTIAELYVVRRALELAALNEPQHDASILLDLRQRWSSFDVPKEPEPDFVLHDEDFHVRVAKSSGNRSLTDLLMRVNERIRIVRIHDFLSTARIRTTITEHLGILEALLHGDLVLAEARLACHLKVSRQVVERRAAAALSRMVEGNRSD